MYKFHVVFHKFKKPTYILHICCFQIFVSIVDCRKCQIYSTVLKIARYTKHIQWKYVTETVNDTKIV